MEDGWEVAGLSQQDEWELCMGALLAALHAGGEGVWVWVWVGGCGWVWV